MKILAFLLKFWLYATIAIVALFAVCMGLFYIWHKNQNAYAVENGKVLYKAGKFPNYGTTHIKEADPETFEVIKYPYAKDGNYVYLKGQIIKGANPKSFELMNMKWRYGKDDQAIYLRWEKLSEDLENFKMLDENVSLDGNQVYYWGDTLEQADPHTFEVLGNYYYRDKNLVYWKRGVVQGANPMSFELVKGDKQLGKDGDKLYRDGQAIDNQYKRLSGVYTIDSKHAYYKDEIIADADPKSFEIVEVTNGKKKSYYKYAKDANKVYLENKVIPGADPSTFELLGGGYGFSKDSQHGYHDTLALVGSHGASLELMEDMFPTVLRDKNQAYDDEGKVIPDVNGGLLKRLSEEYASDGKVVIYRGEVIPGADGATFVMTNKSYHEGKDKQYSYQYGKREVATQ